MHWPSTRASAEPRSEGSNGLTSSSTGYRLIVRKAKSEAGTGRRPPIAEPLRPILLSEFMRQGRREVGAVSAESVMSGKIAERARERWTDRGPRADHVARVPTHLCELL